MTIFSKRTVLAVLFLLTLTAGSVGVFAQVTAESSARSDQSADNGAAPVDESTLPIGAAPDAQASQPDSSAASSFFAVFRVVLVLALVCAGIWGLVLFLKKSGGINVADDPYLKSVASLPLGQNKTAQVLTVGTRAFLVGVTDSSVNLLAELDDRELIDAMNLSADRQSSASVAGFQAILSSFLPGMKGPGRKTAVRASSTGAEPTASEPASFGAELIRRQRERLGRSVGDDESGDAR